MKRQGYIGRHARVPTEDERIQVGTVWLQPIDEILEYWTSIEDGIVEDEKGYSSTWETILDIKRGDGHYEELSETIQENGFTQPTVAWYDEREDGHYPRYGNGNHRLAIAIDLGLTHIPMILCEEYMGSPFQEDDSPQDGEFGTWTLDELSQNRMEVAA